MAEHSVLDVSGTVYRAPASEHIRADWQLPDLFSHFAEYDNAPEGGRALTTFNIGDHGSGVPPHVHGEAWITAIYGAKKWFLYAPGNLAPPPQLAPHRQNQILTKRDSRRLTVKRMLVAGTMPRSALPDPLVGLQHWEEEVLSGLSPEERPMECLQEQVRNAAL